MKPSSHSTLTLHLDHPAQGSIQIPIQQHTKEIQEMCSTWIFPDNVHRISGVEVNLLLYLLSNLFSQ